NLWKMNYVFNILRPQPGLRVKLRDPAGSDREVEFMASFQTGSRVKDLTNGVDIWNIVREEENLEHLNRVRYAEMGDELVIIKFPEFAFDRPEIDAILGRMRKHKAVILDLRGNPGGSEETLKWLVGGMFENDVKIADVVGREVKQKDNVLTAK